MNASPQNPRHPRNPRNTRNLLVLLLAMSSLLTTAMIVLNDMARGAGERLAKAPPVWYELPRFSLVDHEGRTFTSDDLRGRVSLVNFIFTRCQGPCPAITSVMAGVQFELQKTAAWEHVQLVSVSVDPEHDTPAVLAQYAGWSHAAPGKWRFVTGPRADVWRLIAEGFKLPVGETTNSPAEPFFHSQKFALVDGGGRIRGMYDALEPDARALMLADMHRLLAELK